MILYFWNSYEDFFADKPIKEGEMKAKILLVEDDYALAMGTEYALQAEGYEVICAGNIEAANNVLIKDKPDLVLLDVMLPDGNGYELCREVRNSGNLVPIIFLTAVGEEANITFLQSNSV